ncbi:hypothetical protein AVEN_41174-1 [Araneus ventricosus]|uniref:RNase H type-1 domain-containing protein n=1 Tax=Araneus ventricosus TaxID=182803 RepID=A0A4Y2QRC3_ARAVE|nr:hypothetical protein AVEN_41174-1 [Araneus ventricosus]
MKIRKSNSNSEELNSLRFEKGCTVGVLYPFDLFYFSIEMYFCVLYAFFYYFYIPLFYIHKAIDCILDHQLYDIKIVSDSRSALMTVTSLNDQRELIWNIKNKLKGREDIELMWVRAHMGERGNELADMLAKDAANREMTDVQFTHSIVQMRNINNKRLKELWQRRWMESTERIWTRLIYPEINMTQLSADFH